MKENAKTVKVAVVQASPIIMDKDATLKKTISLIKEAADKGAKIVVFPEAFIPAYPRGLSFGFVVGSRTMEGRKDWQRYYENSVAVPSDVTEALGEAAHEYGVYLSIGITERDADEINTTLYCTVLFFGPNGEYLGKHRKLKPTGSERLIWGEGDGSTLTAVDTPYGKMGSLICWENYMPLARAAMYAKGVKIYIAPTADSREIYQNTIKHIALEGRCFVISCNQYVEKSMYPKDLNYYHELEKQPEIMCPGGSCIIDPLGRYVVEPVYNKEEILIGELDLDLIVQSRLDFDVTGHYSRPDVFELIVHE
ncbi:carbon-nitrogen hydrolase family protein [Clostridium sp. MSJ-11]|uniref:Carbon-nitrogen hydrolase family protein n=1 Tax=Clostridium mobile TaxID=2841512 RepID=A0ABS6EDE7_9CLOT|nr:carbon-nitrogen hydrolase family protein [Clostridium mobile]MBU5483229.1 carbon-nitrogen hydrolase family protein [Clostridium mobile]